MTTSVVEPGTSADAIVVGGVPAGLSAALYLARYNRSALVFDTGHGRSTHHQKSRNYLRLPDGIATIGLRTCVGKSSSRPAHRCGSCTTWSPDQGKRC